MDQVSEGDKEKSDISQIVKDLSQVRIPPQVPGQGTVKIVAHADQSEGEDSRCNSSRVECIGTRF